MINGFGSVYSPPLEASEDIFRRVTQGSVGNFIPEQIEMYHFLKL